MLKFVEDTEMCRCINFIILMMKLGRHLEVARAASKPFAGVAAKEAVVHYPDPPSGMSHSFFQVPGVLAAGGSHLSPSGILAPLPVRGS